MWRSVPLPVGRRRIMLRRGAARWLLRLSVRSRSPRMQFFMDSFVTPSAYLAIDRLARPPKDAGLLEPRDRVESLAEVVFPVLHPKSKVRRLGRGIRSRRARWAACPWIRG